MNVGLTAKIGLHSFHLAPEIIMLGGGGGGGDHFGMLLGVPTFLVASSEPSGAETHAFPATSSDFCDLQL